ncbi:MAG: choice-of-anchor V domain-containing protein [Bryobacteraceae bacterium]
MKVSMRPKHLLVLLGGLPILLFAYSSKPPVERAGVPTDSNGATCALCHGTGTPATGSVSLDISTYVPSQPQLIHVKIADTSAQYWGFQLTARSVSDTTQEAGTFTAVDSSVVVICDNGSPAPCNGTRQFAEQANAPNTAAGAGYSFMVNWTPPDQEIGQIEFYVAAVAGASESGTGDHTYTYKVNVPLSSSAACNNTGAPTLAHVVDAAAFTSNLASAGLWTIYGSNFETSGLKRTVGLGDFVNGAFPTELACIAVQSTDASGNKTSLPITYVQTDQINFQGPATTGSVSLEVISNAGKQNATPSASAPVNVLPVAPTFFTFNGTSIAAQIAGTSSIVANPAVVPSGNPALPGDIVTLYGTGFGATNPSVAPGALATGAAPVTASPITVTVGTVTLSASDVLYLGLSPGSISGLYQLNIRIPATTPEGNIPVVVSIGGQQTQSGATIPVQSLQ